MNKVNWIADYMVTALGCGTDINARAILDYKSGIKPHNIGENTFIAAPINWAEIPISQGYTKLESLMIFAIENLKKQVNQDLSNAQIIFSTTKGNIDLLASADALSEDVFLNKMAENISRAVDIKTNPIVISNACISGISALIMASRLIQEGKSKDVIVVGADLLSQFVVTGFQAFKSVSPNSCIPYDEKRDGLSMGEACGAVLLSSENSTNSSVSILSGAITNDANHISGPSRTGDGLFYAIDKAINESGITKEDISFISAHGTATVYNDEMESKAINWAELNNVLTNSLKPYFGHTLGACGVIESILSVWQLKNNIVFGTKGFQNLGTPMPLNINAKHSEIKNGNSCLKIASGFGGCNAAMILSKATANTNLSIEDGEIISVSSITLKGENDFSERIRQEYKELGSANMKFFKMDNLCKLGYVCAEKLLAGQTLIDDKTRVAIILSNKSSSLDTDIKHQELLNSSQPASPAIFVYTLANIVSGEICIKNKIQGENTFIVQQKEGGFSFEYAKSLIKRGTADLVIYGWCDLLNEKYNCKLELLKRK
ncbi:MAG: beta-ACP synthase [Paludibacteraceae bacterium]|nr:beta-ACP synthase [Paludibacteraceae bacterium]